MIRKYTEHDTDTIVSIWRAASAVAHPFLSPGFIESEAEALRNIYLKHAETWVIEADGQVVGFAALIENDLVGLFLDPDCHGRGMGKALVDHATGLKGPLTVEVFEKNAIGRRFYARYGFTGSETYVHDATGETVLKLAC